MFEIERKQNISHGFLVDILVIAFVNFSFDCKTIS